MPQLRGNEPILGLNTSGGQYRQYHLETLTSIFTSHWKFSSSTTSSFSKECYHHLHQICISKNDTSLQH